MNDVFDLKRFGWLFRKFLLERPMQIIGLFGLTLAITLLAYALIKSTNAGMDKAQGVAFTVGIIAGGSFMASAAFAYFGSNASGVSFLLLPASQFEKWLCGILLTCVLFAALYLGFFRLIDLYFIMDYRRSLDPHSFNYREMYNAVEVFPYNGGMAKSIFVIVFNIAGCMLVGSLYFNKVAFIKVALLICGLVAGIYLMNNVIAQFLFSKVDTATPYQSVFIKVGKEVGIIDMPASIDYWLMAAFNYFTPATLWLTAFLRLKEKEI